MSASIHYLEAKPQPLAPHELDQQRKDFLNNVDVTIDGVKEIPAFNNDVPHVRNERVIKPTGMPPDHWRLV